MKFSYFLFTFLYFLGLTANAQTQSELDQNFVKHDISKIIESVDWSDPFAQQNCDEENKVEKKTEIVCLECNDDVLNLSDYTIFKSYYASITDVPYEIKQAIPGETCETIKGTISLVVAIPNDNKLFGLWGLFFGEDGDDFGESHGSSLELKKTFENDLTFTLDGSTNVYTKATGNFRIKEAALKNKTIINRDKIAEQYFTNEQLVKLSVDNIATGKTQYFKVGIGWINLNSKDWNNAYLASGQQHRWHDILKSYNFDYLPNGKENRDSLNVEFFLGLQKNLINSNSSCRLKMYSEFGGAINNVKASYLSGEAGGTFYFQKENSKLAVMAGASGKSILHKNGVQSSASINAGVQYDRAAFEVGFDQKFGKLQNHVDYNLRNRKNGGIDSTITFRMRFILGSIKN